MLPVTGRKLSLYDVRPLTYDERRGMITVTVAITAEGGHISF